MPEKQFNGRIVHKHDTSANWVKATGFVPKQGEIIVYDIDDTYDYERIKVGDGVTNVNSLPFTTTVHDHSLTFDKMVIGTLGYVTPEMFGATGNGVTDDSDAIISALNTGKIVFFENSYGVSKELKGIAPAIIGNNAIFNVLSDVDRIFYLTNATAITGLIFNCNNHGVGICIFATHKNIEISNVEIYDLYDARSEKGSTLIHASNNERVSIKNISVYNCSHIINGVIGDSGGNLTCIYVTNHSLNCNIENIVIKEIHNIDSDGNIVMEDGGGIYVRTLEKQANTSIRNIYGYNFCKRLIKTQCAGLIVIDGVKSYTNTEDHSITIGVLPAEISEQAKSVKCLISNCYLVNEYIPNDSNPNPQYLVSSTGDVSMINCYMESYNNYSCLVEDKLSIKDSFIYGYGVYSIKGNFISIDNTKFEGLKFCSISGNSSSSLFMRVSNCTITKNPIDPSNTSPSSAFETGLGEAEIVNNFINNMPLLLRGNNYLFNNIISASTYDAITIIGNATINNLKIYKDDIIEGNLTRAINIRENATLKISQLETSGFTLNIMGNGSLDAKGVDINLLYTLTLSSLKIYPEYYDTLPKTNNLIDGVCILLSTDNKMYKLTDKSWIAVNN